MKTRLVMITILAALMLGCVPHAVKPMAAQNAILARRMAELVEAGETTREQEQKFIQVNAELWTSFDDLLGGKVKKEDTDEEETPAETTEDTEDTEDEE